MPADRTINLPKDQWILITSNDVTTVRFQNLGNPIRIAGTAGTNSPDNEAEADIGYIVFERLEGAKAFDLAEHFPGIAGCNRLWAMARGDNSLISVSHA